MTKLRREKKLIPQEQKGMGDKGRRRFDTWSTAVSEMSPTPTTRPALIFKALSPADSTGPLPSSYSLKNGDSANVTDGSERRATASGDHSTVQFPSSSTRTAHSQSKKRLGVTGREETPLWHGMEEDLSQFSQELFIL